jgi:hypothetical protein
MPPIRIFTDVLKHGGEVILNNLGVLHFLESGTHVEVARERYPIRELLGDTHGKPKSVQMKNQDARKLPQKRLPS